MKFQRAFSNTIIPSAETMIPNLRFHYAAIATANAPRAFFGQVSACVLKELGVSESRHVLKLKRRSSKTSQDLNADWQIECAVLTTFTPILRGHTETRQQRRSRKRARRKHPPKWPLFALVFDCETRTDEKQSLTFGFVRLLRNVENSYSDCRVEIIFFDPEEIRPSEIQALRKYAAEKRAEIALDVRSRNLLLLTKQEFIERFLFPHLEAGSLIVGFNLPFDLARLASDARPATRLNEDWSLVFDYTDRKTGRVERDTIRRIKITRKDGKVTFIRLSGYSKRKGKLPYGRFLDLFALAWSLRSVHYSLDGLAKDLKIQGKLNHTPTGNVTAEEISYCRQDVRVTVEILNALRTEFDCHPIHRSPDQVYSPASIFKAYLEAMGISPPLKKFRLSSRVQGIAAQAYYGGRSEVRIRHAVVPIVHTDFLSEYPTVITLMGLWPFVTAKRLRIKTATSEVRIFLEKVLRKPDSVYQPELWKELSGYALVKPDNDILPIRTEYSENSNENIGLNILERADYPIWFAIPHLVVSVLLSNKLPHILKGIRIVPEGIQEGLQPVALRKKEEVDPISGNLYKTLIEAKEREKKRDKDQAYFLKIMANSGYGIFIETTPKRVSEAVDVEVFSGEHHFKTKSKVVEEKGKFYCPVISSLITAGGHLLLAILEREVTEAGGSYLFCDTDSMAIVAERRSRLVRLTHPEAEKQQRVKALSWRTVRKIIAKFERLNPYVFPGSILKVEKDSLKRQLYGFGVSAKRYCLLDERSHIVHASSHGLGHLYVPRAKWNKKVEAPEWVKEAWEYLIKNDPHASPPSWFSTPALMRIAMTTPKVQMWRASAEKQAGLPYRLRMKPFNFVVSPIVDRHGDESHSDGYPKNVNRGKFMLIAPFNSKSKSWYRLRYTNVHNGKQFSLTPLGRKKDADASPSTLERVVRTHQLHAESKSTAPNGDPCSFFTRGLLQRTRITAEGKPRIIGKETDRKWEQEEDPSLFEPMLVEYRPNETARITTDAKLQNKIRHSGFSVRELARRTGLNLSTIQNARMGRRIRKSTAGKLWHFLKKR